MKSKFSLCTILFVASTSIYAATHIVTSLADDGSAGTLRSVVSSAVDGDIVEFADAISGGTILINKDLGAIEISSSISVVGPESAPITLSGGREGCAYSGSSGDATPFGLLFASNPTGTLTLKNLIFTGAMLKQDSSNPEVGPAVSVLGNAIIDGCCWTNIGFVQSGGYNNDTGDGGACLRVVGDLNLSNSKFIDNGMLSVVYSMGGNLAALGDDITIKNCQFKKFLNWGATRGNGNTVRGGAAMAILGANEKRILIEDCYFNDVWANAGAGAIFIRRDIVGGTFEVNNCIFREIYGYNANKFSSGGGVIFCDVNANIKYIIRNSEFSNCGSIGWGGAVLFRGSGYAVFANCLFYNVHASGWGGVADSRCNTYVINCTAVGSANAYNDNNASGTFFMEGRTFRALNSAFVWNYSYNREGVMVLDDYSRYGGPGSIFNSYCNIKGNGPQTQDNMMNYDETTKMFTQPIFSRSTVDIATIILKYPNEMKCPTLTYDTKKPNSALSKVEILPKKDGGVLDMAGWPVKHSADWSSIAFSKDRGATWTALCGEVENATILVDSDSCGEKYKMSADGFPKPPIGATTVKKPAVLMIFVY